ncbi:MAG TPA: hypothetical protein VI750_12750, partial [Pyrinomonadaceae bacterium]|nr:hypothetical protein [Pyrinomonadaceae bacterium]
DDFPLKRTRISPGTNRSARCLRVSGWTKYRSARLVYGSAPAAKTIKRQKATAGLKGSIDWTLPPAESRLTFASWYMMNGGDLYELAKILGHSNIKMTEPMSSCCGSTAPEPGTARGR